MRPDDVIRGRLDESARVIQRLGDDEHLAFARRCAEVWSTALREGRTVLFCGNGGSAADATHLAAEFVGRFSTDRASLPALSLSDNTSAVTSIANDYSYAEVFARQVRGLGREGDVLVALSTSGTSANVLAAVQAASDGGLRTVGMTGEGGGALADACELCLRVPSGHTPRIQEATMLVAHTVCELVERELFS